MDDVNLSIKDAVLLAALPDIAFDGWTHAVLERAAVSAGYTADMARAVFPRGEVDAAVHFSGLIDRRMMAALKKTDTSTMRVRDRIALAVRTRFEMLEPYREAERLAAALWVRPIRKIEGAKLLWKTADTIWIWAGDTAMDYNRHTKRALLSGVLGSALLYWLSDPLPARRETEAFLDRRIEGVLRFGQIAGRFKKA